MERIRRRAAPHIATQRRINRPPRRVTGGDPRVGSCPVLGRTGQDWWRKAGSRIGCGSVDAHPRSPGRAPAEAPGAAMPGGRRHRLVVPRAPGAGAQEDRPDDRRAVPPPAVVAPGGGNRSLKDLPLLCLPGLLGRLRSRKRLQFHGTWPPGTTVPPLPHRPGLLRGPDTWALRDWTGIPRRRVDNKRGRRSIAAGEVANYDRSATAG